MAANFCYFPFLFFFSFNRLERYGELELFLHGLELGSFIELFHRHQVSFHQLLQLTDSDLEKVSIFFNILNYLSCIHKMLYPTLKTKNKNFRISNCIFFFFFCLVLVPSPPPKELIKGKKYFQS